MTKQYDLVVIGRGTGASSVAARCRAAGWVYASIFDQPRPCAGLMSVIRRCWLPTLSVRPEKPIRR